MRESKVYEVTPDRFAKSGRAQDKLATAPISIKRVIS